jgi:hypothetical protein
VHTGQLNVQPDKPENLFLCKIIAGLRSVKGWQVVCPFAALPGMLHHLIPGETHFDFPSFAVLFGCFVDCFA